MPRPALKDKRREQILRSAERCVAKFGVEGTSLELIAKEAGLARALIRHNVGNRDELITALFERFLNRSTKQWAALEKFLPDQDRVDALIEFLFSERPNDPELVLLTEAMIAYAARDRSLAKRMQDWLNEPIDLFCDILAREFPCSDLKTVETVAVGILGIYFNADSFALAGELTRLKQGSKAAAQILVEGLKGKSSNC